MPPFARSSVAIFTAAFAALVAEPQAAHAKNAQSPTCTSVIADLQKAARSFQDLLPSPEFVADKTGLNSKTAKNIKSIKVFLSCDEDNFKSYETYTDGEDEATLVRWTYWSTASYMATSKTLTKDRAFNDIKRLQSSAIGESNRELVRSGDKSGCARIRSGGFEVEYSVQPGQVRVAIRAIDDENDSCKLIR